MMEKLENLLELGGMKKDILFLVLSGAALILSMLRADFLPFDFAWIAILLCGLPIILEAIIGLVTEFDIKADVLVSIALIASVCIGEDFAAGEVAFIMQLGSLLEEMTVAKARAGIEKLVALTPRTARILAEGQEKIVPANEVKVDDILKILPGETIPVDGIITKGNTSVNQAVMTGESIPVDKDAGDEVSSGTINQFGAFEMKATKVGEDSSIQRLIRLVQSADAGKSKIVNLADRWATWIVVIALSSAVLTWLITGQIIRAVTILVVFCPCSLVLATPTAIMAAIGNATRHGFLVREGDALERLAKVKRICFDKTGTLTLGRPGVVGLITLSDTYSREELYKIAASVESLSEHPLGKAIVQSYKGEYRDELYSPANFQLLAGRGVKAEVNGCRIAAGNLQLMEESKNFVPEEAVQESSKYLEKGCSVIYLGIDGRLAGYLVLSDTLRKESLAVVSQLKENGVMPILLTGDHENAARQIAKETGIEEAHGNCLPEDKLAYIEEGEKKQERLCMIGDGINDAPALKRAFVGIAMGGIGSDIAVDAADIVLVDDEIKELPWLFILAKRMMSTIKVNLSFSMLLNFAAILLAMTGILNPVVGALVHNAGSVLVIVNSAVLLKVRGSEG
ncbi:MAG: heavy metal translocating P-type ATPase [Lachnospiraceae bacterium]